MSSEEIDARRKKAVAAAAEARNRERAAAEARNRERAAVEAKRQQTLHSLRTNYVANGGTEEELERDAPVLLTIHDLLQKQDEALVRFKFGLAWFFVILMFVVFVATVLGLLINNFLA